MQISIDHGQGYQIHSYQNKIITIGEHHYTSNIIVTADKIISPWAIQFIQQLTPADCQIFTELDITVLIVGTGEQQQFLDAQLLAYFASYRIGVEVMNTAAACRTFNVLAAEQRKVAAALIIDD